MKKMLAALLAVAMLVCTLTPMAFAEDTALTIAGSGETFLEFEDYADAFTPSFTDSISVTEHEKANGGGFITIDTPPSTEVCEAVIPIYVEKTGIYSFFSIGTKYGAMTVTLDDETDPLFTLDYSTGSLATDPGDPLPAYGYGIYSGLNENFTTFLLPKGEHTLTLSLVKREASSDYAFCADYVKFTFVEAAAPVIPAVEISATEDSYIDFANYAENGIRVDTETLYPTEPLENSAAHSGYLLDMAQKYNLPNGVKYDMEIDVEADGYFDLDWVVSNINKTELLIDDEVVLTATVDAYVENLTVGSGADTTYPGPHYTIVRYNKEEVELTAGPHTVSMILYPNANNQVLTYADYLKFTPVEGPVVIPTLEIAGSGDSFLEFETYAPLFTEAYQSNVTVTEHESANGGGYLTIDTYNANQACEAVVNINVEKTGIYSFSSLGTKYGAMTVTLDDETDPLFTLNYSTGGLTTDPNAPLPTYGYTVYSGLNENFTNVYLPAGEHTLTLSLVPREGQNPVDYAFCADFVKFTFVEPAAAVVPAVEVSATEDSYIDFANYAENGIRVDTETLYQTAPLANSAAHSGYLLDMAQKYNLPNGVKYDMEIDVAADGYFDLDWVVSNINKTELLIDDEVVLTATVDAYVENLTVGSGADTTYPGPYYTIVRYNKEEVELTAGPHTVTMILYPNANNQVLTYADYLKFTPVEGPVVIPALEIAGSGDSILEFETYAPLFTEAYQDNITVGENANASGDKYLTIDTYNANQACEAVIDINVATAGKYSFRSDGTKYGAMTITLDDETTPLLTLDYSSGSMVADAGDMLPAAAFGIYTGLGDFPYVNLPAGEHTLKLSLVKREANNDYAFCADYLKFTFVEAIAPTVDAVEISATEASYIDFADYAGNGVRLDTDTLYPTEPLENSAAHSGYLLNMAEKFNLPNGVEYEMDIDVAADGFFDLEWTVSPMTPVTLSIDGEAVIASSDEHTDITQGSKADTTYPAPYYLMYKYNKASVELAAGPHTVTMTLAPNASNQVKVYADYLKFTPVEAPVVVPTPVISSTADTYLEFEDFTDKGTRLDNNTAYPATVLEHELAHGGALLDMAQRYNLPNGVQFDIEIETEADSYYHLEWVVSDTASVNVLKVDGETIFSTDIDGPVEDLTVGSGADCTYPAPYYNMFKFYKTNAVQLNAGTHTVSVEMKPNASNQITTYVDYLKFTPSDGSIVKDPNTVAIAADGGMIEFEEFVGYGVRNDNNAAYALDTADPNDYASGEALLNMAQKYNLPQGVTFSIPVDVEATGWYTFDWIISAMTQVNLKIGGETVIAANGATNAAADLTVYKDGSTAGADIVYPGPHYKIYQYQTTAYLEAGYQMIEMEMLPNASNQILVYADCLAIAPSMSMTTVTVPAAGTRLEMEDYLSSGILDNGAQFDKIADYGTTYYASVAPNEYASGEATMNFFTVTNVPGDITFYMPVVVEEAGWYEFDFAVSPGDNEEFTASTVYVDGSEVTSTLNAGDFKEDITIYAEGSTNEADILYGDAYYEMHIYTGKVYLTAGNHTITMVSNADIDNRHRFVADYLDITPTAADDSADLDVGAMTVSAEVFYDAPISGTAYFAMYAGGQLVGIEPVVMDNSAYAAISDVAYDVEPDTLKVIVLSDLTTIAPQAALKDFVLQ